MSRIKEGLEKIKERSNDYSSWFMKRKSLQNILLIEELDEDEIQDVLYTITSYFLSYLVKKKSIDTVLYNVNLVLFDKSRNDCSSQLSKVIKNLIENIVLKKNLKEIFQSLHDLYDLYDYSFIKYFKRFYCTLLAEDISGKKDNFSNFNELLNTLITKSESVTLNNDFEETISKGIL